MFKKLIALLFAAGLTLVSAGCSTTPTPKGLLFTSCRGPFYGAASGAKTVRVGEASSYSLFYLFAFGDASVQKAAREAGITRIHHVDYDDLSFLILFARYTTVVYGE